MKTSIKLLGIIGILFVFTMMSCENKPEETMNTNQQQTTVFSTSTEAVEKGKKDLAEILKLNPKNDLNIDPAMLERATQEESINTFDIDLENFIKSDSLSSLTSVVDKEKGKITPLYSDGKLITTIHTRQDEGVWSVASIKDVLVESELSQLRSANSSIAGSQISLFEFPNIDAHVYVVNIDGSEAYYTNYQGNSLSEAIDFNTLRDMLRKDAMEFQRVNADLLKQGKLVK